MLPGILPMALSNLNFNQCTKTVFTTPQSWYFISAFHLYDISCMNNSAFDYPCYLKYDIYVVLTVRIKNIWSLTAIYHMVICVSLTLN